MRFPRVLTAVTVVVVTLIVQPVARGVVNARQLPAPVELGLAGAVNEHASVASDGPLAVVAWGASVEGGGTNVHLAVSRDGGATFAPPVRVNSTPGQASLNVEQPPRVVLVRRPEGPPHVVVVWTAKLGRGTALLTARSIDGGRTFTPTTPVAGTEAAGNRGWQAVAAGGDGRVFAAWLDHRDTVATPAVPAAAAAPASSSGGTAAPAVAGAGHAAHQHGASAPGGEDPTARAQRSQLFFGEVGGAAAPRGIARGVCYCCKTSLVTAGDGRVVAAWRHVYPGSVRDIAVAESRDGGRTFGAPVRVSQDGWQIDGCPENGPSAAIDAAGGLHVLWPSLVRAGGREQLQLFLASAGAGLAFGARTALPTSGAAYHPQLLAVDGRLVAAWDETTDGGRRVRVATIRVAGRGAPAFDTVTLESDGIALAPALAGVPGHTLVAYTSRRGGQSRIAVARLPRR